MSGTWIAHDGGLPLMSSGRYDVRSNGGGIQVGASISSNFPGFFWRWRRVRVGWFRTKLVRICDDPTYAPIIAYRRCGPSPGMALLSAIAADPCRALPAAAVFPVTP